MSEKYIVTDMLQIHARKLASRLMPSEQWKGIIAVSRGGLVPGALLARTGYSPCRYRLYFQLRSTTTSAKV